MAQTLTTPVARDDVTQQGITKLEIRVPHKRNAGDTAMELNKPGIDLRYEVTTWNESGDVIERTSRYVDFASWPAGFKTDIKGAYAKAELDAINNGLIGVGTPEALE